MPLPHHTPAQLLDRRGSVHGVTGAAHGTSAEGESPMQPAIRLGDARGVVVVHSWKLRHLMLTKRIVPLAHIDTVNILSFLRSLTISVP